ncbi:MAG: metallophosphoesterase family protein [Elusimicrobiota bacterium]
MIYGVFSDVHSNYEALSAVLDHLGALGVEGWICPGDMVGYGPDADACLDRIRALGKLSAIAGNHDLAVLDSVDLNWFNQYARAAILWTRDHLSGANKAFLQGLSTRLETPHFSVTHGTPRNPVEEYMLSPLQFRDNVPLVGVWPLFVGHSHMPLLFRFSMTEGSAVDNRFLEEAEELLPRAQDGRFAPIALNPGSVGQPRDHDNRASCGVYDSEKGTFRIVRVPYDIAAVQEKIRAAGLPEYSALRLAFGQ